MGIRRGSLLVLILLTGLCLHAQQFQYQSESGKATLFGVFDPASVSNNWLEEVDGPDGDGEEMPLPGGMDEKVRKQVDAARSAYMASKHINIRGNYAGGTPKDDLGASAERGFDGTTGSGTPNDNHIAVSNAGRIINVLNTSIRVYNDTGKFLKAWSLDNFVNAPNQKVDAIPALKRVFDPRVLYDPIADRFVIVFMEGTLDSTSMIVVAFSSSNNPQDKWFVYKCTGKPTADKIWSDYPIVTQNRNEIFFTVNLIGNNASWEEGFTEAVIWQLNKADGFAGQTMNRKVYTGIKFNGKSLRSICPVQNGPVPDGTDNYFITVRPIDIKNDTLFLLHVTNTIESGSAKLELTQLKTDIPYGFPPSALQPDTSFKLRTNDVRVLSAIRVKNTIQYMQNCMNFKTFQAHLTHGFIYDIDKDPLVRVRMITDDSLDMGYPALASTGNTDGDPSSVITFVYSSPWHYPGCAMIYHNRYGEYSKIVKLKKGTSLINYGYIPKGEQRWGDYEGIQWKYNEKNVFYMVGSYSRGGNMAAWISRVRIKDDVWENPVADVRVFPVPARNNLYIELREVKEGNYTIELYNSIGQKVKDKPSMNLQAGTHLLRINPDDLANGTYTLRVLGPDGKKFYSQQILVE